MRKLIVAAAAAMAFAVPASANPAAGIVAGGQPQADTAIERVHGAHRACRLGPLGWHYHWRGDRHVCGVHPGAGWIWHFRDGRWGWWSHRHRRWHGH